MTYQDRDPFAMSDELSNVGFTQLPLPVLFDTKLTSDEKILYSLLLRFTGSDGVCFPGVARLAKGLRVHQRTIQRYLSRLIDRGLVRRIERNNETNLYDLGSYRDVYGEGHNSGRLNDETLAAFREAGEEKLVSRLEKAREALYALQEDLPGPGACSFMGKDTHTEPHPEYRPRQPVETPGKRFEGVTDAIKAQEQKSLDAKQRREENRKKLHAMGKKPKPRVDRDSLNTGETELGAPSSNTTTMNARDFQVAWNLCFLEQFGFETKWGPKEFSQLKTLTNRFVDDQISRDQVYEAVLRIVKRWDEIAARYGKRGYPSLGVILSYSDSWVREQLHGEREPDRMAMACLGEDEKESEIQIILRTHREAFQAKWNEDPSTPKDAVWAKRFLYDRLKHLSIEEKIQLVQDTIQYWEKICGEIKALNDKPRMSLFQGGFVENVAYYARNFRNGITTKPASFRYEDENWSEE